MCVSSAHSGTAGLGVDATVYNNLMFLALRNKDYDSVLKYFSDMPKHSVSRDGRHASAVIQVTLRCILPGGQHMLAHIISLWLCVILLRR
jgi:pentatricopeptide repeat protein